MVRRRRSPGQILPAPSLGGTGVAEARAAGERVPVYALGGSVDIFNFQIARFSVFAVGEDLLYELVPPEGVPHIGSAEQGGQVAESAVDGPNFYD